MADINFFRALSADISSKEFELLCCETLKAYAERENLKNCIIQHDIKQKADDSTYQIDVFVEFTVLEMRFKTICECKRYKRNVERKVVAELHAKLQSTGCQKGIIISTSGFQKDAVKYAAAHGITLWQVVDCHVKTIVNSAHRNEQRERMMREYYKMLPSYYVLEWDLEADYPYDEIYPTEEMKKNAKESVQVRQGADVAQKL